MKIIFTNIHKYFVKSILKTLLFSDWLGYKISKKRGRLKNSLSTLDIIEQVLNEQKTAVELKKMIPTADNIILYTPNSTSKFRADTFFTKEPEVLDWINRFGGRGDLWDIGANVGLYSIFCAKKFPRTSVKAFEPSPFNLKLLSRNISANNVSSNIQIMPIALTRSSGFQELLFGSITEGGALNAFGVDFGYDGVKFEANTKISCWGASGDFLINSGIIKKIPTSIKIDVDGIEHYILSGMENILKSKECQSVYIEANRDFKKQYDGICNLLIECGFSKELETRSKILENSTTSKSKNQIWIKGRE